MALAAGPARRAGVDLGVAVPEPPQTSVTHCTNCTSAPWVWAPLDTVNRRSARPAAGNSSHYLVIMTTSSGFPLEGSPSPCSLTVMAAARNPLQYHKISISIIGRVERAGVLSKPKCALCRRIGLETRIFSHQLGCSPLVDPGGGAVVQPGHPQNGAVLGQEHGELSSDQHCPGGGPWSRWRLYVVGDASSNPPLGPCCSPAPLLVRAAGTETCIARKDKLEHGKKQLFGDFKKASCHACLLRHTDNGGNAECGYVTDGQFKNDAGRAGTDRSAAPTALD